MSEIVVFNNALHHGYMEDSYYAYRITKKPRKSTIRLFDGEVLTTSNKNLEEVDVPKEVQEHLGSMDSMDPGQKMQMLQFVCDYYYLDRETFREKYRGMSLFSDETLRGIFASEDDFKQVLRVVGAGSTIKKINWSTIFFFLFAFLSYVYYSRNLKSN